MPFAIGAMINYSDHNGGVRYAEIIDVESASVMEPILILDFEGYCWIDFRDVLI